MTQPTQPLVTPVVVPNTPATNAANIYGNIFGNSGKTIEKIALYVMGILQASGWVTFNHVNPSVAIGSIAAILLGLHVSTPTPKSGPGQL